MIRYYFLLVLQILPFFVLFLSQKWPQNGPNMIQKWSTNAQKWPFVSKFESLFWARKFKLQNLQEKRDFLSDFQRLCPRQSLSYFFV